MCACGNESRPGQRNCLGCHAASMRKHRANTPMTPTQRMKDNCRSYSGAYLRRGKLTKEPCEKCGSLAVQMHHDDYSKPLDVRWLCSACHKNHHKEKMK